MNRVSHSVSVGTLLERGERFLKRSPAHFGHGTDNARDEAVALLWHVLQLDFPVTDSALRRRTTASQRRDFERLLERRVQTREPSAYLTGRTWFAGLPIRIDRRALIPRSPLAELIEARFEPWVEASRVRRILDLGTGSGCIAIACAHYLRRAQVDASDVSAAALSLARENIRALRLRRRVRTVLSDHFENLGSRRYDMIVSNPPYVGEREMRDLPAEYLHEPSSALAAGRDGLASVRAILAGARAHLEPDGVLFVEVGDTAAQVRRAWPRLPFTWLEFERGGGGVFMLRRDQIPDARHVR